MTASEEVRVELENAIRRISRAGNRPKNELIDEIIAREDSLIEKNKGLLFRVALNKIINEISSHKNRVKIIDSQLELFTEFPHFPNFEQVISHEKICNVVPGEEVKLKNLQQIVLKSENRPRSENRKIRTYRRIIEIAEQLQCGEEMTIREIIEKYNSKK